MSVPAASIGRARTLTPWRRVGSGWVMTSVGVLLLVVLVALATTRWRGSAPATDTGDETVRVVALLPPENLSGDPSNDFLGAGLADSLFTDLSGLPDVRVVAASDVRAETAADRRDARAVARSVGQVCWSTRASSV